MKPVLGLSGAVVLVFDGWIGRSQGDRVDGSNGGRRRARGAGQSTGEVEGTGGRTRQAA